MSEHHDSLKNVLDLVAVFSTVGAFLNLLAPIFGLIGAIVGIMRIVEMYTGKPFSEVIRRKKDDAVDQ
jgi:hypothetical protein